MARAHGYSWERDKDAQLGKGSFGRVYRGEQLSTGMRVAIKEMSENDFRAKAGAGDRFQTYMDLTNREIETHMKLNHPNVVKCLNSFAFEDRLARDRRHVIVMEYCDGGDMEQFMHTHSHCIDDATVIDFLQQMHAGLQYLHSWKIVHRDLKPANILRHVDPVTKTVTYKIADFGMAKHLEDFEDTTSTELGTPNYMAPEVASQSRPPDTGYGIEVDLWSLGAILFKIIFNRLPFAGQSKVKILATIKNTCHKMDYVALLRGSKLNRGSQDVLACVLSGLLRDNPAERFKFDHLTAVVDALRTPVHVFDLASCSKHQVFVFPTQWPPQDAPINTLQNLMDTLSRVLHEGQQFEDAFLFGLRDGPVLQPSATLIPATSFDNPLVLCDPNCTFNPTSLQLKEQYPELDFSEVEPDVPSSRDVAALRQRIEEHEKKAKEYDDQAILVFQDAQTLLEAFGRLQSIYNAGYRNLQDMSEALKRSSEELRLCQACVVESYNSDMQILTAMHKKGNDDLSMSYCVLDNIPASNNPQETQLEQWANFIITQGDKTFTVVEKALRDRDRLVHDMARTKPRKDLKLFFHDTVEKNVSNMHQLTAEQRAMACRLYPQLKPTPAGMMQRQQQLETVQQSLGLLSQKAMDIKELLLSMARNAQEFSETITGDLREDVPTLAAILKLLAEVPRLQESVSKQRQRVLQWQDKHRRCIFDAYERMLRTPMQPAHTQQDLDKLQRELASAENEVNALRAQMEALTQDKTDTVRSLEQVVEAQRAENVRLVEINAADQSQIKELATLRAEHTAAVQNYADEHKELLDLQAQCTALETDNAALEAKLAQGQSLAVELEAARRQVADLEAALARAQRQAAERNQLQLTVATLQTELDGLAQNKTSLQAALSAITAEHTALTNDASAATRRVAELEVQVVALTEARDRLQSAQGGLGERMIEMQADRQALQERVRQAESELENARDAISNLMGDLEQSKEEIVRLRNQPSLAQPAQPVERVQNEALARRDNTGAGSAALEKKVQDLTAKAQELSTQLAEARSRCTIYEENVMSAVSERDETARQLVLCREEIKNLRGRSEGGGGAVEELESTNFTLIKRVESQNEQLVHLRDTITQLEQASQAHVARYLAAERDAEVLRRENMGLTERVRSLERAMIEAADQQGKMIGSQRQVQFWRDLWRTHHNAIVMLANVLDLQNKPRCCSGDANSQPTAQCQLFTDADRMARLAIERCALPAGDAQAVRQVAAAAAAAAEDLDVTRPVYFGPGGSPIDKVVLIRAVNPNKREWVVWNRPELRVSAQSVTDLRLAQHPEPFRFVMVAFVDEDNTVYVSDAL